MTKSRFGRLLFHPDGESAWNMAVDQATSESASRSAEAGKATRPTLRFYTWSKPTLSLGYFQSSSDSSPRFDQLARVRRSTGGGAILHHHELTYSLIMPVSRGEHGARSDLYREMHAAITVELARMTLRARPFYLDKRHPSTEDAFLCFQRRTDEDLIVSGYKVLGSAQRRFRRAILQHGSLLLRASEYASELPGIFDLTSVDLDPGTLTSTIATRIGDALGVVFENGELTPTEQQRAEQIQAERFNATAWWLRR